MDILTTGLITQRISYITCILVWIVAYGRRRADLVLAAVVVHIVYIMDIELITYHQTSTHGISYYTRHDGPVWLSQAAIVCTNGGIAMLFVYSTGLIYIIHERIAYAIAWIAIIAVYSSELVDELILGVRVTISAALFTFYIYERMTRHAIILTDPWAYKSGYSAFYVGLGLFVARTASENVSMQPLYGAVAFALVNIGTALVLLSTPRADKHEFVISAHRAWY